MRSYQARATKVRQTAMRADQNATTVARETAIAVETTERNGADFLGLYLTQGQTKVFFRSAPTARSPRAATHDSRLAEKIVDFEEL